MATYAELLEKLPDMLKKLEERDKLKLQSSPVRKQTAHKDLVNSPSIRQLSAVKSAAVVRTPGGVELTVHTKPKRADPKGLLWVSRHPCLINCGCAYAVVRPRYDAFNLCVCFVAQIRESGILKGARLGSHKCYVMGREVQSLAEVATASYIKFPIPEDEIPVEVFCLPTKEFSQYYTVKRDKVHPYHATFPKNADGDKEAWSASYRENFKKVVGVVNKDVTMYIPDMYSMRIVLLVLYCRCFATLATRQRVKPSLSARRPPPLLTSICA
jgi:hypothetical protein